MRVQRFTALEAEVEVSCHCWISRCHNELRAAILLKVVCLWDIRICFLSRDYNFIHLKNKPC
jgi:hypothetical protein